MGAITKFVQSQPIQPQFCAQLEKYFAKETDFKQIRNQCFALEQTNCKLREEIKQQRQQINDMDVIVE
jgi:septal ring factor EnvC (AmiA/AmiB activator)